MADHVGKQVGDYRLLRRLGGGGFGEVYLAEHVRDHAQAALKLLQVRLTSSEELKAFINEARTIRLKHPHIVPLLDFGIGQEESPFLVMEYAPGGTLRDKHPKGSRLPLNLVCSYVAQVASALQYAHDQRLIHRDVKPENMLIRADNTVMLTDFGIAAVAHSSQSVGMREGVSGTLPYMAPEQIQGHPHPTSDQYALAVVAYEWICGNRPFQGTTVELAMQHVMKEPPSLQERVPNLPAMVEEVIRTALAKDPTKRFASMRAFATALEQACMLEHPRPLVVEQPALQSPLQFPMAVPAPTVVAQTMYDMTPPQESASQGTPHATFYQSIAPSVTPQIIPPPPPAYHPLEPEKQPSERGKKAAVIGFTLSIINLIFFVYLIIFGQFSNSTLSVTLAIACWLITLIATPTGVVFSSLGLRSRSRKILAILGLIIGVVALIVVVVFSILVFSYVVNHKY